MAVQTTYQVNPDIGYPGEVAQPNFPHAFDSGVAHVASGIASGRELRPGDGLQYNRAEDGWQYCTDPKLLSGILVYRQDRVQKEDSTLTFADGDEIEVCVFGSVWVRVGAAAKYSDRLEFSSSNHNWSVIDSPDVWDPTTAGSPTDAELAAYQKSYGRVPVTCASRLDVSANGIAIARIGYGRVF